MSTVLEKATREWESRPADERFGSLQALHNKCVHWRDTAAEAAVSVRDLYVKPVGDDLRLVGSTGAEAEFTNWSFGQLCTRVGVPAGYVGGLPAELAAENVNYNISQYKQEKPCYLMLSKNDTLKARSLLTGKYQRIWNADITERLLRLSDGGTWQPAPPAFDASRGLYASDHDMFAFMVDNNRRIFERGPGGGLSRGFFVWNSEVGASSFGIMKFFYEYVCGNHRVWGATGIEQIRLRHIGEANDKAFSQLAIQLQRYADDSSAEDEAVIQRAHKKLIAASKEEVLDAIFGLNLLSRRIIEQSYEIAEARSEWYGDPKSVWGFVGGLTERAAQIEHTDKRVEVERASGKIMAMAF